MWFIYQPRVTKHHRWTVMSMTNGHNTRQVRSNFQPSTDGLFAKIVEFATTTKLWLILEVFGFLAPMKVPSTKFVAV